MTAKKPELAHPARTWTFLSNHAHVLICLARDPDTRLRDVAELVGITERGVQRIIAELEEAGAITRTREGRRNHYDIDFDIALRHQLESDRSIGCLLSSLLTKSQAKRIGLKNSPR